MHDREPNLMKRLLERLLAARARRDREVRFSEPWRAADAEMHAIERAIFRVPLEAATDERELPRGRASEPTPFHHHARPSATDAREYDAERAG